MYYILLDTILILQKKISPLSVLFCATSFFLINYHRLEGEGINGRNTYFASSREFRSRIVPGNVEASRVPSAIAWVAVVFVR